MFDEELEPKELEMKKLVCLCLISLKDTLWKPHSMPLSVFQGIDISTGLSDKAQRLNKSLLIK